MLDMCLSFAIYKQLIYHYLKKNSEKQMPVYVPWKCQNPQNDKNHPHPPLKNK